MVFPAMASGRMTAASPRMNVTLKMFEPTTLPMATASFPRRAAIRLTASSGTEVPAATTVSPMTAGVTRASVARVTAPRSRELPAAHQQEEPEDDQTQRSHHGMAIYSPVTSSSMPSACGGHPGRHPAAGRGIGGGAGRGRS